MGDLVQKMYNIYTGFCTSIFALLPFAEKEIDDLLLTMLLARDIITNIYVSYVM